MAFPVTTINQPVVNNGSASCQAGSLIVGFHATSGVVTVFDMATETTSAWQMTSPSGSHALSNPATPWLDTATGLVWTFFSTSPLTNVMFVSFNPVTGSTAYYPTSSPSFSGARRVAAVGQWVVGFAGGQIIRFDKTSGTVTGVVWTGRPSAVRPFVYGGFVYYRFASYSVLTRYSPTTNVQSDVSGAAAAQAAVEAQPAIVAGKAYVVRSGGVGLIVHDLAAETSSLLTVVTGYLGAALAVHSDGRFYSKPSNSLVGCWDPVTFQVTSASQSGTSTLAVSYGGYVYFPAS